MKRKRTILIWVSLAVMVGTTAIAGDADNPLPEEPARNPPLLQDLFKDLGNKPRQSTTRPSAPSSNKQSDPTNRSNESAAAGEDLGEGPETPLTSVARRMHVVREKLRQQDVSETTQAEQQRIVDELSALIEQSNQNKSRQQAAQRRSDSQNESASSSPAATTARTKDGNPEHNAAHRLDPGQVDAIIKGVWGQLPDRVREQIRTPLIEEFLPKYERSIADFYRRLAEEERRR